MPAIFRPLLRVAGCDAGLAIGTADANPHQPTRRRERQTKRFKSARHAQRLPSAHDKVNNLFHLPPRLPSRRLSSRPDPGLPSLGRGHQRCPNGATLGAPWRAAPCRPGTGTG
jgi:hypothetical protein